MYYGKAFLSAEDACLWGLVECQLLEKIGKYAKEAENEKRNRRRHYSGKSSGQPRGANASELVSRCLYDPSLYETRSNLGNYSVT